MKKAFDKVLKETKTVCDRECKYYKQANHYSNMSHKVVESIGYSPLLSLDDILGSTAQRYLEKRTAEEKRRNKALKCIYHCTKVSDTMRMDANLRLDGEDRTVQFLSYSWVV